eukprot:3015101-Amphidinium_carterae.2
MESITKVMCSRILDEMPADAMIRLIFCAGVPPTMVKPSMWLRPSSSRRWSVHHAAASLAKLLGLLHLQWPSDHVYQRFVRRLLCMLGAGAAASGLNHAAMVTAASASPQCTCDKQHQIRDNATMQNNDKKLAAELQKHILAAAVRKATGLLEQQSMELSRCHVANSEQCCTALHFHPKHG